MTFINLELYGENWNEKVLIDLETIDFVSCVVAEDGPKRGECLVHVTFQHEPFHVIEDYFTVCDKVRAACENINSTKE